jgi:acyl carrier protein
VHNQQARVEPLSREADVIDMIQTILRHQSLPEVDVTPGSELYDDGIGLDSLCVAELSAMLEKAYGKDPYTSKILPGTVGDIIAFYGDD